MRRHRRVAARSALELSHSLKDWFYDVYVPAIEKGYYGVDYSNVAQAVMETADSVTIARIVRDLLKQTSFEFRWPKHGGSMLELMIEVIAIIVMATPEFKHLAARVDEGDVY